jgi:hypothetical protein
VTTGEDLLDQFFGSNLAVPRVAEAAPYGLNVLIATLPDPVESHLDWAFDAEIEAIRRAYETSGFVTDRFWLPSARDSIDPGGGRPKVAARQWYPGVLLFRRSDPMRRSLRLLYIVPELPTSGVYKGALVQALAERARLVSTKDSRFRKRRAQPVRLVAPTFSGSATSIRQVLLGWLGPGDSVDIISGSATGLSNLKALNCRAPFIRFGATVNPDESLMEVLRDTLLDRLQIKPSQVALLQESSTQYGQTIGNLAGPGLAAQFQGGGDSAKPRQPSSTADRCQSDSEGSAGADTTSALGPVRPRVGRDSSGFLSIPFPIGISSLRTEYQLRPVPKDAGPGLPGQAPPRLPLDLIDPVRPMQDLPVSSRLTPPALDLELDEVARTLREHNIRVIGLLATDVRDKLFLGGELRQRIPDAQFFTFESSSLLLRPDQTYALRGMFVLSSYPVLLENQWAARRSTADYRLSFSSDAAEGIYNATLSQLGQSEALLEYDSATGRPPVWLTVVGRHGFLPLAKVTGTRASRCYVGHRDSTFVLTTCESPKTPLRSPPQPRRLPLLAFATTVLISLALIVCGVVYLVMFRAPRGGTLAPSNPADDLRGRRLYPRVQDRALELHRQLYGGLLLIALAAAFIPIAIPLLVAALVELVTNRSAPGVVADTTRSLSEVVSALASRGPLETWFTVLSIAACLAGLTAIVTGFWRVIHLTWASRKIGCWYGWQLHWGRLGQRLLWRLEVGGRLVIGLFGLSYFGLAVWFGAQIWQLGHHSDAFGMFFLRAGEIDNLVSPLLPLVLTGLGYAVWCAWHIARIRQLQTRSVFEVVCARQPAAPGEDQAEPGEMLPPDLVGVADWMKRVRDRLFLAVPIGPAVLLLVFLVALFLWLWPQFGPTLEAVTFLSPGHIPGPFDLLLRISILGSLFAISWASFRLIVTWNAMRGFLDCVLALPLASAFNRLPERLTQLTRLSLPSFWSSPIVGSAANEQWLHLQRIFESERGAITASMHYPDAALLTALMQQPAVYSTRLGLAPLRTLATQLSRLHGILSTIWSEEPDHDEVTAIVADLAKSEASRVDEPSASISARLRGSFGTPSRLWLRAAEEYEATHIVYYIEGVVRNLRLLALFLSASLVVVALLLVSYPFQPQSLLRLIFGFVLIGAVGATIRVMVQMNRNEVLSRIQRTEPGRLSWDGQFLLNLVTFGLIPLLTLLSSAFPGLRDTLFSWAEPLIKALAKAG